MCYRWLYTAVLAGLFALVALSMGAGLWGEKQSIGHWTGNLFQTVCHQNPDRSFTVNRVPMAVNSRCFGIFSGLWAGWLLIPLFIRTRLKSDVFLWLLLFAVLAQIIDYSGNLFRIWENTTLSRSVLGGWLGLAASLSVSDLFKHQSSNRKNHE